MGLFHQLRACFALHREDTDVRLSHFFHGRYENLYLPQECLPEIEVLLTFVESVAREALGEPPSFGMHTGFWFNLMQSGQLTALHTHDEDDELFSAVYYVTVPPASGDLILFPLDLPHEVAENCSAKSRLSIGMNIGPA